MNNTMIDINDIRCGMLFRVKEDCVVKGFNLEKDTNLYVKKIYSRGDKVSFVVPAHLLKDRSKKTLAVGAKYINLYFENKEVCRGKSLFDMLELNKDVEIDNNKKNGEVNMCKEIKTNNKNIEKSKNVNKVNLKPDIRRTIVNGTTTIVILRSGEKGVAKCHEDDEYVEEFGHSIAYAKAKIKAEMKAIRKLDSSLEDIKRRYSLEKDECQNNIDKLRATVEKISELSDMYTFNIKDKEEELERKRKLSEDLDNIF